jgi:nicotinate-nucleotide adenylyltransferase
VTGTEAALPRRIGVYGGSFDPIHRGHLEPVEEARRRLGLDAVVFVPAYAPPHKPSGPSASAFHRFAMAALALAQYPAFFLSDFEVERGGTTYSIETLRHFRANLPGTQVLLVIGSDSLLGLPSWRKWGEIVEEFPIGIVYREPAGRPECIAALPQPLRDRFAPEGATPADAPEGTSLFWGGNSPVTISSTWIRKAVVAGEGLAGSVPPPVETYLRREGIYQPA